MTELLNLKDLATGGGETLTIEELTNSSVYAARSKGWSLRAIFPTDASLYSYSSNEPKRLMGIYALPTDEVLRLTNERAEEAIKQVSDLQSKLWAAEKQAKEANEEMWRTKELLRAAESMNPTINEVF